ncbi:hypothetical protein B0H17DRAFT_1129266 [Mycena rosella]|uniref:Uncharacterized protein n=1 Tax=Mycena rosella TaxID=1033263 RepID=A0AAD7DW38_MYCRO|nr:hypothetical protein B0H17DRAFT_1129266 [Mycena rosella]
MKIMSRLRPVGLETTQDLPSVFKGSGGTLPPLTIYGNFLSSYPLAEDSPAYEDARSESIFLGVSRAGTPRRSVSPEPRGRRQYPIHLSTPPPKHRTGDKLSNRVRSAHNKFKCLGKSLQLFRSARFAGCGSWGEDGLRAEEEDPERVEQLGEGEKEQAKPQAAYTTPEQKLTTGGLRYGAVRLPQPELE